MMCEMRKMIRDLFALQIMTNYQIRKIEQKDRESYKTIRLEALKEEPYAFSSGFEESLVKSEDDRKQGIQTAEVFIAFTEDGLPVGMLWYFRKNSKKVMHVAHAFGVYVSMQYRWKGIWKNLLTTMQEHVKKNEQFRKINLAVTEKQYTAIGMYKKLWFQHVWTLHNELCIDWEYVDEYLMEYLLD